MIAALLSGAVAQHIATRGIFLVQALLDLSALFLIACHSLCRQSRRAPDSERSEDLQRGNSAQIPGVGLGVVLQEHWRALAGAGVFCTLLSGIRSTWVVALPLCGHYVGLSKVAIGCALAVQRACEATVTALLAGHMMDEYGLKAVAVPSLILISAAFALLSAGQETQILGLAAFVFSVGNGMCGGILNTFATH